MPPPFDPKTGVAQGGGGGVPALGGGGKAGSSTGAKGGSGGAPAPRAGPSGPGGPSVVDQATKIGEEVKAIPKGSGQLQALADKVTGLHLDQQQAAEATEIAAKTAFGETAGIAKLPDGTEIVLPKYLPQRVAMMVHPDGSVTIFNGDLSQFVPYLAK